MDVIRHDDVSSNQPRIGSGPGTAEQRISIGVSKYWLSILRADRHKYDYRGIELFARGQMQWVLTIRVVHLSEGRPPCRPEWVLRQVMRPLPRAALLPGCERRD